jgi:hypothetical protein
MDGEILFLFHIDKAVFSSNPLFEYFRKIERSPKLKLIKIA